MVCLDNISHLCRCNVKTMSIMSYHISFRRANLVLLLFILAVSSHLCAGAREIMVADSGWLFHAGSVTGGELPQADLSGWTEIRLPHDFQISQPWVRPDSSEMPDMANEMANVRSRLSSRAFKEMGEGWYRFLFTPPAGWQGQRIIVDFEGILLVGDVWVNGKYAGGTDYGYLGFEIDLTDLIRYDGPNLIAVRADTGKPDNSRWYTGGGLYRGVSFKATDPDLYFVRHPLSVTTPVVSTDSSLVVINGEIANMKRADSVTIGVKISDPSGKEIYQAMRTHRVNRRQRVREMHIDSIFLSDVRLWDIESPDLYTASVVLYHPDGRVADSVDCRFGIRQIEFSPDFGLRLNGRKVLLKGNANHHTLGALGAAAYPRAIEKRLRLLKEFGFNHIRTSHNPYSTRFLELCDELGILVVDELYDKWTRKSSGGRRDWMEAWQHDLPEWVRRDRNHPSVVMWSLGNELQTITNLPFNDWGVTPFKLQKTLLSRYDGSRPVTVAMHPRGRNEFTDSMPAPLALVTDVASYNYRYGYFPGDSRRYPWMIFYQSEANTSGMGPNFFGMDLDRVVGLAYWGMIDYLGESAGWPAKGWNKGVFDISLEPKPMAYFLRSFFKPEEPVVRIAVVDGVEKLDWNGVQVGTLDLSSHWNRTPGSVLTLYTFTNADEVELLINGESLGRRINDTIDIDRRNRLLWDSVPFREGHIEARAYRRGGKMPVATHIMTTAGDAVAIRLAGDNPSWLADGMALQHIRVEAVDRLGNRNPLSDNSLQFAVEGPAEIVGVINGDICSDEPTTGDSRRLWRGSCEVILRSYSDSGQVNFKVTDRTGQLRPAEVTFKTLRKD